MELAQEEKRNIQASQMQHVMKDKEVLEDRFRDRTVDNSYVLAYQREYYESEREIIQDPAHMVVPDPDDVDISEPAPPATVPPIERGNTKKERSYIKTSRKIKEQYNTHREAALKVIEHNRQIVTRGERPSAMSSREKKDRKALLGEDLKSIDLFREASVKQAENDKNYDEKTRLEIDWKAQADRAKVYERYARSLPLESKERASAMKDKEKAELKAADLKRAYKTSLIENPVEKKREEDTISRHAKFDFCKGFFKLFKKKDKVLSKEDAKYRVTNENEDLKDHLLLNVGRAHMGGTKPMYIYEDRTQSNVNGEYKQYLYKEAINCCGISNTEGAIVTEAASKLQQMLRPGRSITAFTAKQDGRIIGSFQEKVNIMKDGEAGKVDLFSWQENPQDTLTGAVKSEIMEEHVLDWVLCNFDTKGENFLQESSTKLLGSDKEASLKFLFRPEAQKMSTTYKPHSNDTIYNVLFSQFAQGKIDLDLEAVTIPIIRLKDVIAGNQFMNIMGPALEAKYKDKEKCDRAKALLLNRAQNIEDTYREFFTELLAQRRKALGEEHMDHLNEMEPYSHKFLFRADRMGIINNNNPSN